MDLEVNLTKPRCVKKVLTQFSLPSTLQSPTRDSSQNHLTTPLSQSPLTTLLRKRSVAPARRALSRASVSGKDSPMKQLSVLCLSLVLVFSLSGCCCGLFGHGGGGYGAGYPYGGGGGCNSCGSAPGGAFYGGYPATGSPCGPGGCGVQQYPSGSLYGGPSAAISPQGGPVAFAPATAIGTF